MALLNQLGYELLNLYPIAPKSSSKIKIKKSIPKAHPDSLRIIRIAIASIFFHHHFWSIYEYLIPPHLLVIKSKLYTSVYRNVQKIQ